MTQEAGSGGGKNEGRGVEEVGVGVVVDSVAKRDWKVLEASRSVGRAGGSDGCGGPEEGCAGHGDVGELRRG